MLRKIGFFIVALASLVFARSGNSIISGDEEILSAFGMDLPLSSEWEKLLAGLERDDLMKYDGSSFYDIRSNETGVFSGSGKGDWNRFGYTLWLVKDNVANVSVYTIEKYDDKADNKTFLKATYMHVHLVGNKHIVNWNSTANIRTMLQGTELQTLLNTTANATGYLDILSDTASRFEENSTLLVNDTIKGKVIPWSVEKSGVINVFEDVTDIQGFARGLSSDESANWAERFDTMVFGKGKLRSFNVTSDRLFDDHKKPITESRNSSGYIWDNESFLNMELPQGFNQILPSIFKLFF